MNLFLLLSVCLWAEQVFADHPGQGSEKLPDLIAEALANSPAISAEGELLNAAKDHESIAVSSFSPSLSAAAGRKIEGGSDVPVFKGSPFAQLDATWNLYRGRGDQFKKNIASIEAQIVSSELEAKKMSLASSVAQTFAEIQNTSESLDVIEKMISAVRHGKDTARRRFSTGQTTSVDALEFEILDDKLRSQRAAYQADEVTLTQQMRSLLGRPETQLVKVQGHLPRATGQLDQTELTTRLLSKNQDLAIANLKVEQAKSEINVSTSKFLPLVDAKGSWGRLSTSPISTKRMSWSAEISMTMPIFSGLSTVKDRSAKIHEKAAYELDVVNIQKTVQTELYSLVSRLKSLEKRQILEENTSEKADKYLQMTNAAYGRGIKSSADLAAAFELVLAVHLRNLEFRKEWCRTKFGIQTLTGSLPSL